MINRIINLIADRLTGLRLGDLIWAILTKIIDDKTKPMTKTEVDNLIRQRK